MFSLSLLFVNHMRYECCAGGTTCNNQRLLFSVAGGLRGTLSPPAVPGQGVQGAKLPEAPEILQFAFGKIHPPGAFTLNYNFMDFVD